MKRAFASWRTGVEVQKEEREQRSLVLAKRAGEKWRRAVRKSALIRRGANRSGPLWHSDESTGTDGDDNVDVGKAFRGWRAVAAVSAMTSATTADVVRRRRLTRTVLRAWAGAVVAERTARENRGRRALSALSQAVADGKARAAAAEAMASRHMKRRMLVKWRQIAIDDYSIARDDSERWEMESAWQSWKEAFVDSRRASIRGAVADSYYAGELKRKAVTGWKGVVDEVKRDVRLVELSESLGERSRLQRAFARWRELAREGAEKEERARMARRYLWLSSVWKSMRRWQAAMSFRDESRIRESWMQWRAYVEARKERRTREERALVAGAFLTLRRAVIDGRKSRAAEEAAVNNGKEIIRAGVMRRALRGWRTVMGQMMTARLMEESGESWRRARMLARGWSAWRERYQERKEEHQAVMRRVIGQWRNGVAVIQRERARHRAALGFAAERAQRKALTAWMSWSRERREEREALREASEMHAKMMRERGVRLWMARAAADAQARSETVARREALATARGMRAASRAARHWRLWTRARVRSRGWKENAVLAAREGLVKASRAWDMESNKSVISQFPSGQGPEAEVVWIQKRLSWIARVKARQAAERAELAAALAADAEPEFVRELKERVRGQGEWMVNVRPHLTNLQRRIEELRGMYKSVDGAGAGASDNASFGNVIRGSRSQLGL